MPEKRPDPDQRVERSWRYTCDHEDGTDNLEPLHRDPTFGPTWPTYGEVLIPLSAVSELVEQVRAVNNTLEDYWPCANDITDGDVLADAAIDLRVAIKPFDARFPVPDEKETN